VTRVILQCRSRFWEGDGCNGFGASDLPQEIFHPTFDQPGTRGLLVAYMLTGVGQQAAAMDLESRTAFVAQETEKIHPGLLGHLEGCVSKVWTADPWTGGAGSQYSPGQLTTLCVGLEQTEGRVHFAGEHISAWPYWMQGALQSGLRAAKGVHEANIVGGGRAAPHSIHSASAMMNVRAFQSRIGSMFFVESPPWCLRLHTILDRFQGT